MHLSLHSLQCRRHSALPDRAQASAQFCNYPKLQTIRPDHTKTSSGTILQFAHALVSGDVSKLMKEVKGLNSTEGTGISILICMYVIKIMPYRSCLPIIQKQQ